MVFVQQLFSEMKKTWKSLHHSRKKMDEMAEGTTTANWDTNQENAERVKNLFSEMKKAWISLRYSSQSIDIAFSGAGSCKEGRVKG